MLHKCQVPEPAPQYFDFQKDPLCDLIHHQAMKILTLAQGHTGGREKQLEIYWGSGVGAVSWGHITTLIKVSIQQGVSGRKKGLGLEMFFSSLLFCSIHPWN